MLLPSWDLWGLGSGSGPLGSEHQPGQSAAMCGGWSLWEGGLEGRFVVGQEHSLSCTFIGGAMGF